MEATAWAWAKLWFGKIRAPSIYDLVKIAERVFVRATCSTMERNPLQEQLLAAVHPAGQVTGVWIHVRRRDIYDY